MMTRISTPDFPETASATSKPRLTLQRLSRNARSQRTNLDLRVQASALLQRVATKAWFFHAGNFLSCARQRAYGLAGISSCATTNCEDLSSKHCTTNAARIWSTSIRNSAHCPCRMAMVDPIHRFDASHAGPRACVRGLPRSPSTSAYLRPARHSP
jgi:hypothetical protein